MNANCFVARRDDGAAAIEKESSDLIGFYDSSRYLFCFLFL